MRGIPEEQAVGYVKFKTDLGGDGIEIGEGELCQLRSFHQKEMPEVK